MPRLAEASQWLFQRRWAVGLLIAIGLLGPWLLAANDAALPEGATRAIVAASLAGFATLTVRWLWISAKKEWVDSPAVALALLALIALSAALHFVGLGFEVGQGYYLDEGIYRATAERVNAGLVLPHNFIYGHLSFYLPAWTLWLCDLFPNVASAVALRVAGVRGWFEVGWLWIRGLSGLCGTLTAPLVFGIGRRIVGARWGAYAGLLGGGLIAVSTLYNDVAHVYISDVPAAFFATVALYFAARLLDAESSRDYLLAGLASGLAAGCKYPAGVVAVAIVAVWLNWRLLDRRWNWGLVIGAVAALVAFLGVMPAMIVNADKAFAGRGKDVFFGVRQYAGHGWVGVVKDSNAGWYAEKVVDTFGLPIVLGGCLGAALLAAGARRRWLVVAVFPLVFATLLCFMGMVVKRNLQPFLPAAAALLGAGAAGWVERIGALAPRWRAALASGVALLFLAVPAAEGVAQVNELRQPGSRQSAREWMLRHVPRGAGIVKESYTPTFASDEFVILQNRFAARIDPSGFASGQWDFVLLADSAYGRFLNDENIREPHQRQMAERTRALLDLPEVQRFLPAGERLGPEISLRRIDPPVVQYSTGRTFAVAEVAFVSDAVMVPKSRRQLEFSSSGQVALFKGYFESGRYAVRLEGDRFEGGRLRVVNRENEPRAEIVLTARTAELTLPAREKVFLYLLLPAGARVESLSLEPLGERP